MLAGEEPGPAAGGTLLVSEGRRWEPRAVSLPSLDRLAPPSPRWTVDGRDEPGGCLARAPPPFSHFPTVVGEERPSKAPQGRAGKAPQPAANWNDKMSAVSIILGESVIFGPELLKKDRAAEFALVLRNIPI